jgi:hypothetical protein
MDIPTLVIGGGLLAAVLYLNRPRGGAVSPANAADDTKKKSPDRTVWVVAAIGVMIAGGQLIYDLIK